MRTIVSPRLAECRALATVAGAILVALLSGCQAPFGLGEPSTRSLENGVVDTLAAARSFEIVGSYSEAGHPWSIDLQLARFTGQHVIVSNAELKLEAVTLLDANGLPTDAYFRGNQYLS